LLLDDVTSELDNKRISKLLSLLKNIQTFITTTSLETINLDKMNNLEYKVFNIANGKEKVKEIKNKICTKIIFNIK
jgi:recombinational DNA repair ATPase RecF